MPDGCARRHALPGVLSGTVSGEDALRPRADRRMDRLFSNGRPHLRSATSSAPSRRSVAPRRRRGGARARRGWGRGGRCSGGSPARPVGDDPVALHRGSAIVRAAASAARHLPGRAGVSRLDMDRRSQAGIAGECGHGVRGQHLHVAHDLSSRSARSAARYKGSARAPGASVLPGPAIHVEFIFNLLGRLRPVPHPGPQRGGFLPGAVDRRPRECGFTR
jgi:hypothetical protein